MLKLSLFNAASVTLLLAAGGADAPAAAATPTGGTTSASNPTGKQMAPSRRPRQQGH